MRRAIQSCGLVALLSLVACSQSGTGVLLTVNGPGVVADQLSIVVGNEAHVVPATAAVLHFPTTLVVALPDHATTATVQVAALRSAVSIAWGATAALQIGSHQIVSASVDLGPTVPDSGLTILPTARFQLINQNSLLCIGGASPNAANGVAVEQLACATGDATQQWQFIATDSGYYRVVNMANNLVLEVTGGEGAIATHIKVDLWAWMSLFNQQWKPLPGTNGYHILIARHSGRCLDVPGGVNTPGTQLQQSDCNGTGAQAFQLILQ